jgi:hypothetical protein
MGAEWGNQGQLTHPKQAEKNGRSHVPTMRKGVKEEAKQGGVASHLLAVLDIRATVQTLFLDTSMQESVLGGNVSLDIRVE